MSRKSWLLQETPGGYIIAGAGGEPPPITIGVSPQSTAEQTAEAIGKSLQERGYRGEPVVLALCSRNCLAATVPHTGRSMARNAQAMGFALEELPVDMEAMSCDFVSFDNEALGVAVEVAAVGPLLSALEQQGVQVASITAAALLALQHQVKQGKRQARQIVLWQNGNTVEMFELRDGRPRLWRTLSDEPEVLARELKSLQFGAEPSQSGSVLALGIAESLLAAIRSACGDVAIMVEQASLAPAALKTTAAILSGGETPWIELRRSPLGEYDRYRPIRGRLKFLAFAVASLLLMLSAAAWIRGDRYMAVADGSQQKQEEIFRHVFPGKSVPVGVGTRLASEYQKLAATKGQSQDVPHLESATRLLHEALASLPTDIRFRLLEMYLESGQVRLEGEVRRHGDADLVVAGLRNRGFHVGAPRTEQLGEKAVSVTVLASFGSDEAKKSNAGE